MRQQFGVQKLVVSRIVGPGEVIRDQSELSAVLPSEGPRGLGLCHPSCTVRTSRARFFSTARPRRNPTCSGGINSFSSQRWTRRAATIRSANLAVVLVREIGRYLETRVGSFPDFKMGMMFALLQSDVVSHRSQERLMRLSRCSLATGPRCWRCSAQIPSGPEALCGFSLRSSAVSSCREKG